MGISFKLSKVGKRYHPKPNFKPEEQNQSKEGSEESAHVIYGAELGRENKVDDYPGKEPTQHSTQEVAIWLSDSFIGEDFTDQRKSLSKSLIGGTINTSKDRTISFMRSERVYPVSVRLIMAEKPVDGTVSLQYKYMDDSKIQDYQLTLPTTNHADLLAAHFAQLMEHDGFQKAEDKI